MTWGFSRSPNQHLRLRKQGIFSIQTSNANSLHLFLLPHTRQMQFLQGSSMEASGIWGPLFAGNWSKTADVQKSLLVKLGCSDTGLLPPCQLRCTLLIHHQSEYKPVSFLSPLMRWHSAHRSTCVHWNQKPQGTYQTKRSLPRKLRNLFSKAVEDWNLYNCCIPFLSSMAGGISWPFCCFFLQSAVHSLGAIDWRDRSLTGVRKAKGHALF